MNSVDIALARLAAVPGVLPLWLGSATPYTPAEERDPTIGLAFAAALETNATIGQRSLEEFLR